MKDTRVKMLGLISFTKKGYIITQKVVFIMLVIFLFILIFVETPEFFKDNVILNNLWLVYIITVIGETCETIIMLKKFKKKELILEELT